MQRNALPQSQLPMVNPLDPTKGQAAVYAAAHSGDYHRIIWIAPVRHGKTAGEVNAMITLCYEAAQAGIGNFRHLIGMPSISSIEIVQGDYWRELCEYYDLRFHSKNYPRRYEIEGVGEFLHVGGDNAASQRRVSGITATHGLLDEAIHLSDKFVSTFQDRLSYDESVCFMSSNAGPSQNWLKVDYIDKAWPGQFYWESEFGENHHIPPDRLERYETENVGGVLYQRNIQNLWVDEGGIVYPITDEDLCDHVEIMHGRVGMDAGSTGTTAAVLIVDDPDRPGCWIANDEYYHTGLMDEEAHWNAIALQGWETLNIQLDPSATMMRARGQKLGSRVSKANNDVMIGVHAVRNALATKRLRIARRCRNLLREMGSLLIDEKTGQPKKGAKPDHACDALRYIMVELNPARFSRVTSKRGYNLEH